MITLLPTILVALGQLTAVDTAPAPATAQGELSALQQRIQAAHTKVQPTIVALMDVHPGTGELEEAATATVVSADGYVVTAAHCLEDPGDAATLRLADGRVVEATTLGKDRERDFGLLKINGEGPFAYAGILARTGGLVRDEALLMYGYPDGGEPGRSAVLRLGSYYGVRDDGMLRSSCAMMPGDSGGPLFDLSGRIVGINSEIEAPLDQNYHVQMELVVKSWARLVAGEVWGEDPYGEEGDWDEAEFDGEGGGEDAPFEWTDPSYTFDAAPDHDPETESQRVLSGGRKGLTLAVGPSLPLVAPGAIRVTSRRDGRRLRAGGLVCGDGRYVVSKSSIVGDDMLRGTLVDGSLDELTVVERDRALDLVLLRFKNSSGTPARWAEGAVPKVGSLVSAVSIGRRGGVEVVGSGAVGSEMHLAKRRRHGGLGIYAGNGRDGRAFVREVMDDSAAERAGLETGDLFMRLAGRDLPERADLMKVLRTTDPGETVEAVVERDGDPVELQITLETGGGAGGGHNPHVAYRTPVSGRRGGFGDVFRHDATLARKECGGPLFDLQGRVCGLNIARADRTGSLALPASVVRGFIERAMP